MAAPPPPPSPSPSTPADDARTRVLGPALAQAVRSSKLLVVGAGGIGCELLKNLVLTGFEHLEIIDLDTIDFSNLNRQFLFRARHVGQPKAVVAREVVLGLNPRAAGTMVAHHANVKAPQFGLDYFKQVNGWERWGRGRIRRRQGRNWKKKKKKKKDEEVRRRSDAGSHLSGCRATLLHPFLPPPLSCFSSHACTALFLLPSLLFHQFTMVLNALDNIDARRHVNRMCLATGKAMIDAGTTG